MNKFDITQNIKNQAISLGFAFCGISKADFLEKEAIYLENWLKEGKNGKMIFIENYFDLRTDPRNIVPNAKSVISLIFNYYNENEYITQDNVKISKYALGIDYHYVLKEKLEILTNWIKNEIGDINYRYFVDSGPVAEKVWAQKAGLGWMGKNTNLIHPKMGSFFFISEIILDYELEYDFPIKDYCGTCTKCITACPTEALIPYQIDSNKCISYLTIELKDKIDDSYKGKMDNWAFGCDICQDVCPWNRFSKPNSEPNFTILDFLKKVNETELNEMSNHAWKKLTANSPLNRIKIDKIKDNIEKAK